MLRQLVTTLSLSLLSLPSFAQTLPPGMPALESAPLESFDAALLARGAFVKLPNGHVLFARYRMGNPEAKKIVMNNGLDDSFETASWAGLNDLLHADGNSVLEYDSRGQGFTRYRTTLDPKYVHLPEQERLGGDLSWKAQLEDSYELLKFINDGEASLKVKPKGFIDFGLSYGGFLTLAMAIYHPEMLDKTSPATIGADPFFAPILSQLKQLKQIADSLVWTMPWLTPEERLVQAGKIIGYGEDVIAEPKLLQAFDGMGVEAILAMGAGLAGLDMSKQLSQIRKGSLVMIVGALDPLVTPQSVDEVMKNSGEAALATFRIEGMPHRAITYAPLAAHAIFKLVISGGISLGSKYVVNPLTNMITRVKTFGPEIGGYEDVDTYDGATCKELFN